MKRQKYVWNDSELMNKAKKCQWITLILGMVGVGGFFMGYIPFVIGVMVALLGVYYYGAQLRKKDKLISPKQ